MTGCPARERGSATLELAVLGPVVLVLLGLVIAAGRLEAGAGAVEQAAAAGARAASQHRTAVAAVGAARASVRANLAGQRVRCQDLRIAVSTEGFRVRVGREGWVIVTVTCQIPLGDQGVAGLTGQHTVQASASSPIDRYRGR